jgi:hypothetical protein
VCASVAAAAHTRISNSHRSQKKQDFSLNFPQKTENLAKQYYFQRRQQMDAQALEGKLQDARKVHLSRYQIEGIKDVKNMAEYEQVPFRTMKGLFVGHHRNPNVADPLQ